MGSPRSPERPRGFALLEVWVALVVLAVLLGGLAMPLAAQVQMRRQAALARQLEEARDAVMGFAAAQGRLPCPATQATHGAEAFAPGGDASNGACADFYAGFLPAATLGLHGVDGDGYARDPWGATANRIRYAVSGIAPNGVANALTRTDGMRAATLAALGAAPHYLFICSSGREASGSGCGPASRQLTRRAAFVILSPGPDASAAPAAGSDEARNLDGDEVFVSREASIAPGDPFDDTLLWVPIHLLAHRLIVAGRLP
ncbi:MAG TPA: prepilin-type N-terminal cleavage/methylation domain-containing protein [Usitatibacter sp.]|nr:prepilin-type N-terminal cleavage/methylation domain-containing protein [Usitatibacter sp.]